MKRAFFTLALLALAPLYAMAGAVYNCPRHGPRDSWQVERRGLSFVCKACEEEKAKKQREDADAARADRIARGDIFESDLRHLPDVTINTRSFGGTNLFERRCLAAIRERYVMVDGAPQPRAGFEAVFKIIQPLGGGAYLARRDRTYCRVETTSDTLTNDSVVKLLGGWTGELFDYTTVLGAAQRVRVFRTLARQGHTVAEVTLADAIAHLDGGGTFRILFPYRSPIVAQPNQRNEFGIWATINQQGGSIVRLEM